MESILSYCFSDPLLWSKFVTISTCTVAGITSLRLTLFRFNSLDRVGNKALICHNILLWIRDVVTCDFESYAKWTTLSSNVNSFSLRFRSFFLNSHSHNSVHIQLHLQCHPWMKRQMNMDEPFIPIAPPLKTHFTTISASIHVIYTLC